MIAAPTRKSVARTYRNSRSRKRPSEFRPAANIVSVTAGSAEIQRYRRLRTVRGDVHPKGFGGDRKAPETGRVSLLSAITKYKA